MLVNREDRQGQAAGSARDALHEIATTLGAKEPVALMLSDRDIDMLKHEYDQNVAFARDTETHRSTVMTFVVTAVGAVVYALAALKFDPHYWPVPLIVAMLGIYAAILTNVYHERWEFHMMMARGFRWRIAAALPAAQIEELRLAAKRAHRQQFTTQRPLYELWNRLAIAISIVGILCTAAMGLALIVAAHRHGAAG